MKIEIGESLVFSWLKHIKECQLVQMNWKASYKWDLKHREVLEQLMVVSQELFFLKYGYDIYKGNKSLDQLLGQAEVDGIGINYDERQSHIYGIDVAFHEAGLNYGSKEETVARVIKKIIRTAMCMYGYFGCNTGTIIFASPKINPAVYQDFIRCMSDINQVLESSNLHFTLRFIGNEAFAESLLQPVINILGDVADTSELFMRSLQMYNLLVTHKQASPSFPRVKADRRVSSDLFTVDSQGLEGLEEMKIGVIVRTVFRKKLETGKASMDEIERMQTLEYSKRTFDIQYPLLQKADLTQGKSPKRYYAAPIRIYGKAYFLCSEWYEVSANNDRPYLLRWLAEHQ